MKLKKFIALLFIFSLNNFAAEITLKVNNPTLIGPFNIGVGSSVQLESNDQKISGNSVFLGVAKTPAGVPSFQMYLNLKTKKIFYVKNDQLKLNKSSKQAILDPYEQMGGTCTGYAIFDFLAQINLSNFEGTKELSKILSSEEGRTQLLADSINQYYLIQSHRYSITGILNGYGKKFGFTCKNYKSDNYEKTKASILKQLATGLPLIVSFNIGSTMAQSPFTMEKYQEPNGELDNRLWIPRKIGQRNNGGHSIVAAAAFEIENKNYMVMIDSDWSEPRVWDMDSFLNDKTALSEIDFISCK